MISMLLLENQARLALASYASLDFGTLNTNAQRNSLVIAGMTQSQSVQFVDQFPFVVTQYSDVAASSGVGTGFDATVFRDVSGNLTLAIRGTLGAEDLVPTDADIALNGAGYDQIVAMVNWWLRASAPIDQMVHQFRLVDLPQQSIPAGAVVLRAGTAEGTSYVLSIAQQQAAGLGLVAADAIVNVTGHSLGGHLALAFSMLFSDQTGQVTVFNAPGFSNGEVNQEFFRKLGGSIPVDGLIDNVTNVIADEALIGDVPSNWFAGLRTRPGKPFDISIENQWQSDEPVRASPWNHGIATLTDSLIVYKLLVDLELTVEPNKLSTADYKRVLNQAVQGTAAGYERIVDALQNLFTGDTELLDVGNNKREDLYKAIQGLTADGSSYTTKKGQLKVEAVAGVAGDFVSNAQANDPKGLAWRYALKELNPFAVIDVNNTGLYARFQAGGTNAGELDLYDSVTRTGTLTTQWLEDRAALLQRRLDIAAKDENNDSSNPPVFSNTNKTWAQDGFYFEDRVTGYILNQGGQRVHDPYIIFGSNAADGISGSSRADRIYGSGGADYLIGKGDADCLEGGTGLDIYEYDSARKTGLLGATSTDGHDTILDVDGKGILRYQYVDAQGNAQSTVLAGVAIKEPDGKWKTPDGRFVLEQTGANLKVTFGTDVDGSATISDFDLTKAAKGGYFGIRLIETQALPVIANTIVGDYDYLEDPENPGTYLYDEWGNPRMGGKSGEVAVNVLQDTPVNDRIEGLTFSDWLIARRGGNDRILGGHERDYIEGGGGNDVLEGGDDGDTGALGGGQYAFGITGGDVLFGGIDNDRLYGNVFKETVDLVRDGESGSASTIRGDVLDGGDGNDLLAGDINGDVLLGGAGDDLLIGGAGDDFLFGDAEQSFPLINLANPQAAPYWGWSITSSVNVATRVDTFNEFTKVEAATPGQDLIYGGAGNDKVFAGGNDDVAWGGEGEDWLFGEGGSDVLLGGAENDVLSGDSASTPIGLQGDDYLDGGDGNDQLFGYGGNDILIGGDGDDALQGGDGDDILIAGTGDGDILIGGSGRDTYIFNRGDGAKTIIDTARGAKDPEASVIVFTDDIFKSDITFNKGSLIVNLGPSNPDDPLAGNDQVHFINFNGDYPDRTAAIGELRFADGSVMDYAAILAQGFDIDGTALDDVGGTALIGTSVTDRIRGFAGSDELEGRDGDDVLIGDGGTDRLDAGNGNDVLDGGAGNDFLFGGMGSDDYRFVRGDGLDILVEGSLFVPGLSDPAHTDRIVFGGTIAREEVSLLRTADGNLTVRYGTGDEILIVGQFSVTGADIERIAFADGQVIEKTELDALEVGVVDGTAGTDEIYGTAGNDVLRGQDGDDYLDGGPVPERRIAGAPLVTGDDVLEGGSGSDTYALYWGMGDDRMLDAVDGQANTLLLMEGVTLDSVKTTRAGDDLVVKLRGGGGSARVQGFFVDGNDAAWQIAGALDGSQSLLDFHVAQSAADNAPAIDAMQDYQQQLLGDWRAQGQPNLDLPTHVYVHSTWSQTTAQWTTLVPALPEPVRQTITFVNDPSEHSTVQGFGYQQAGRIIGFPGSGNSVTQRLAQTVVEERVSDAAVVSVESNGGSFTDSFSYSFFAGGGGPFGNTRSYQTSYGTLVNTITESSTEGWVPLNLRADDLGDFRLNVQQVFDELVIEKITAGASDNTITGATQNSRNTVALIDAGAGNDVVTAGQYDFAFGNEGDDAINGGAYAYGGSGFDRLSGAGFIAGGADDDSLSGGEGETTFHFRSDEAGQDWVEDQNGISLAEFAVKAGIVDSYSNLIYGGKVRYLDSDVLYGNAFSDWVDRNPSWTGFSYVELDHGLSYYEAPPGYFVLGNSSGFPRGVPDELARELAPGWGDGYYSWVFNSVEDVMRDFAELGIAFNPADVQIIPEVADLAEFTADNHEALRPFFDQGVLEKDVVELVGAQGNADELIVGFAPADGSDHRNLRLVWGEDKVIDIELPSAADLIGHGIEEIRFGGDAFYIGEMVEWAEQTGIIGTPLEDYIIGTDAGDVISGLGGWDFIDGGAGNDTLRGGAGIDEFFFGAGAGSDTILDPDAEDLILFDGISPDQITLGLGSLRLGYGDAGDEIHFQGFNPEDVHGSALFGALQFWAIEPSVDFPGEVFEWTLVGELSYEQVLSRGFDIDGTAGNDALTGTNIHDRFSGGTGNDSLAGGAGSDTYYFNAGDGMDVVIDSTESGQINRILLRDYLEADISGFREGQYVVLQGNGTQDAVHILWDETSGAGVDVVEFADGTTWDRAYLNQLGGATNSPPVVAAAIGAITTLEDAGLNFVIPADAFQDPDAGDVLTYVATLDGGGALPSWLSFDAGTRSFSGTPGNGDVGELNVRVTAIDVAGESVSSVFALTVTGVNDAPELANPLTYQAVAAGAPFHYVIPADTFADVDAGDTLTLTARLAGGGELPSWLVFDAATGGFTGTFTGAASASQVGVLDVEVAASDATGASVSDRFLLTVNPAASLTLIGTEFADTLTGGFGNDVIDGLAGADQMLGGDGDDAYFVDHVSDAVVELPGQGRDVVNSSVTYTLLPEVEALVLTGSANLNGTGNALANTITGNAGSNRLDGKAGADILVGGAGNDMYVIDNIYDYVVELADEGSDIVQSLLDFTLTEHFENLTLTGAALSGTGNAAANRLTGNALNNVLLGLDGNDVLNGNTGADTLIGGAGNDTYLVDHHDDVVIEVAGEGVDTIQSTISFSLVAEVENLTLTGTAAANATGNALDNRLTGNAAANTLTGLDGNDILDGKAGADQLIGGAGNDSYFVDQSDDLVLELADQGVDLVNSSVTFALSAEVENLTLTATAAINGTGNAGANVLTGNAAANTLTGHDGNDVLDGKAGADTLGGGAGNDSYVVDQAGDSVVELADQGIDTVQAALTWILGEHVESLTLTGTALTDGTGNAADNTLTGNNAANSLTGLAGNDWLDGKGGNDTLIGGAGDDTYVVAQTGDVAVELAEEGADTVRSGITWTLGENLEHLVLTGTAGIRGTGNAAANVITGNSGNNQLDGLAGADIMSGGAGNDTYLIDDAGDQVLEQEGGGIDLVKTTVTHALSVAVENLTLTGAAAIDGTGNALHNVIIGNVAANLLTGGAGNDALNGGAGADTLLGGIGDDFYTVDNAGDVVVELAGEGIDTVNSSLNYTLNEHVENLALTGSANRNGTGNALDNTIAGNRGINVLNGLAGNDTLAGGQGNDTYRFDPDFGHDVIAEDDATASNLDRIQFGAGIAATDIALGRLDDDLVVHTADQQHSIQVMDWFANDAHKVERIEFANGVFWDAASIESTAMQVVDMPGLLRGSDSASTLLGQIGNTLLEGNGGGDTLTDEDGNNLFSGGTGEDVAIGGDGNDLFAGGSGNDTLYTGAGSNVIAYNAGGGIDTVYAEAGAENTLSLGGGLAYSDLSLSRDSNDLVLNTGADDKIILKDWYAGNSSLLNLQVILDATDAFDVNAADPLYNRRVQNFDFLGMVTAFDAAQAVNPGLSQWALGDALTQYHLSGADDAALGGDLAYWYARNGGFTGIGVASAQQIIGAPGFGTEAQGLREFSGLQEGLVRLS